MKKLNIVLLIIALPVLLQATDDKSIKTLFAADAHSFSVFGGPAFKLVFLNGKSQSFFGGGGAWVFDGGFTFGGSGHATIPDYEKNGNKYHFGYLGAEIGYFIFEKEIISLWPRLLAGLGYVYIKDSDGVINFYTVIEPGIDININITGHTRVTTGFSYLLTLGDSVDDTHLTGADYSGFSLNFAVRFLL